MCVFSAVKKIGRNSILSGFQCVRASLSLYVRRWTLPVPTTGQPFCRGSGAGWWRWDWEAGAEDRGRGCLKWRERGAWGAGESWRVCAELLWAPCVWGWAHYHGTGFFRTELLGSLMGKESMLVLWTWAQAMCVYVWERDRHTHTQTHSWMYGNPPPPHQLDPIRWLPTQSGLWPLFHQIMGLNGRGSPACPEFLFQQHAVETPRPGSQSCLAPPALITQDPSPWLFQRLSKRKCQADSASEGGGCVSGSVASPGSGTQQASISTTLFPPP